MKIEVISPCRANIEANDQEILTLSKELKYTNSSVAFMIKKHKQKRWLKEKDEDRFNWELDELKAKLHHSVLKEDNGQYWMYPGYVPYLDVPRSDITNKVEYPEYTPMDWAEPIPFKPYPYQIQSTVNFLKGKQGNVSLPTGAGKSLIALLTTRIAGLDTVIVTPGKSIFMELLELFETHLGKKFVGGYGDGKKDISKKITIAIGKSLTMLKPDSAEFNFFKNKKVMIVDESHTFASTQLEKVCHGVLSNVPYRFFVSATQTRNDGTEKLLHSIIGKNYFNMSIEDAIKDKYLCPLKFLIPSVISPSTKVKSDPIENKREHYLYNRNIAELYAKIANASWHVKQESSLILVEELRQIAMIKDLLDVPFAYVHSGSAKDAKEFGLEKVKLKDELHRFNSGEVKVLIGTRCIATGTNIYPTFNTMNWMGGNSEIITKQGPMGRSTRWLDKSKFAEFHKAKPFSRIIDVKVRGNRLLDQQLASRVEWYEESGGEVRFV